MIEIILTNILYTTIVLIFALLAVVTMVNVFEIDQGSAEGAVVGFVLGSALVVVLSFIINIIVRRLNK